MAEKSPNWKFGSDKRLVNPETYVPGPGNYNPNDPSSRRGVYIGIKTKDVDGLHVPGPGVHIHLFSPTNQHSNTRETNPNSTPLAKVQEISS